jgi:hypothetical protein
MYPARVMVTTSSSSSIRSSTPISPTRVGVLGLDLGQLPGDDGPQPGRVAQNGLELGDRLAQLGHLLLELRPTEAGEPSEGHVEDVDSLLLGEGEGRRHESFAGRGAVVGTPDGGDDGIEHVDGLEEPFHDVGALARFAQPVFGPPGDDLDLVGHVVGDGLGQAQGPGDAVDEGDDVDSEARLHRRVLVEVVEDDVGIGVPLELDHETRLPTGGVVLGPADSVELPAVNKVGDLLLDDLDRRLVREFGDDDPRGSTRLFDLGHRPHLHGPLTGPVGVEDPLATEDGGSRREVGALHELHQIVRRRLGILDDVQGGVDHLAQVVGRNVGGHAHGDALRAVDKEVGEAGGQDHRLFVGPVVVGDEVHRLLVDAGQQLERQRGQPAFGVAHGRRSFVRPGAPEVAVAVDERVAQAEVLDHPDQRVVDGHVTVRVIGPHDLAHHLGALGVGSVRPQVLAVHRVQDPTVDRLQPVADVGKSPRHDHGHRVLEERALHLLLDLDGLDRS